MKAVLGAIVLWTMVGLRAVLAQDAPLPPGWQVTGFSGVLTSGTYTEALRVWEADPIDSYFSGVGIGYEWPLGQSRFSLGFEAQAVLHFGQQDHLEFNLPIVLRFRPREPIYLRARERAFDKPPLSL